MSKHSPGPWEARGHGQTIYVGNGMISGEPGEGLTPEIVPPHVVRRSHDERGRRHTQFIATCNGATCPNEANARLIAAAPELAEALATLLDCHHIGVGVCPSCHLLAESALKKAGIRE